MQTRYEKQVHQFLAAYRFVSYALAVMFLQVGPMPNTIQVSAFYIYVILGVLGIYTLLRVISTLRWRESDRVTYTIMIGDFLICILLIVFTGGLNSAFLLYSLAPIMTAALLFEEKVALSLAVTGTLSLSMTHLAFSQLSGRVAWVMQGHNLTLLIVYTLFCFVAATVPYRVNLNIRRRIESEAIVEERRKIARELHDGVAQSLGYLNLKTKQVADSISTNDTAQALIALTEVRQVVRSVYDDIRESIDHLGTETRRVPVVAALASYAREFGEKNNIEVDLELPNAPVHLAPDVELQLLRIVQEALSNVRRHASASKVSVKLENTLKTIDIAVKDDGQGFDPSGNGKYRGYHGLKIIKERAEELGGSSNISSAAGEGTEIKVSFPIER